MITLHASPEILRRVYLELQFLGFWMVIEGRTLTVREVV